MLLTGHIKQNISLLQKAQQPPSSAPFWSPPSFPLPPHPLVSLLFSAMHISNQGWMSGGAWELLISGSVLVVSCLSIHTNKGQRSHATGLTSPVFLSPYLHLSTAFTSPTVWSSPHTLTLFCLFLSHFLPPSLSPVDLWSRLGSQNTSKQFLSNGPLLKQSVERPEEDD